MKNKTTTKEKTPSLEKTYETEIEFTCPVRGLVKQKVKVKKYQSAETQPVDDIRQSSAITDQLDLKYSGLILEDDTVTDGEAE